MRKTIWCNVPVATNLAAAEAVLHIMTQRPKALTVVSLGDVVCGRDHSNT